MEMNARMSRNPDMAVPSYGAVTMTIRPVDWARKLADGNCQLKPRDFADSQTTLATHGRPCCGRAGTS